MQSAAVNGLFEFTVNGGQPSGVGIRLSVADAGGAKRPFPFSQQLNVPAGEFTQSSDYYTSLERVGGAPVVYGRVDTIQLATSFLFNGTGPVGAPIPYRRIHIRDFVLVSPSCSIDAGSLRQTVSLGNHVSSDFDNGVGWTPFDLVMGNCSDLSLLEEITFGSLSDADADAPGLFSMNASGPSGLGIAIRTRGGVLSPMLPGQSQIFPAVLTGQVFPFEARLERTVGPVSQGAINRPVVVTVNFR
jgi:type 1 fimbria pilin